MEEIHEVFEQSRKRKKNLDLVDREMEACQEELEQARQDLKEALARQTVLDDKSEAQRVYEMALLDKKMKLQEMRLSTAQLEADILKTQSEGGGGPDKHASRGDPEIHLLTTSREDNFFVKGASKGTNGSS